MDYIRVTQFEQKEKRYISIYFVIDHDKVFEIGKKMTTINEEAYMNGYGWESFLSYYLNKNFPELLIELEPDPEAGSYVAYYNSSEENEKKAEKFKSIIIDLIENENKLYEIVKSKGDKIEWDG